MIVTDSEGVCVCVPYLLMLRTWLTLTDEKRMRHKNSRKKTNQTKKLFVSLSGSGL